MCLNSLIGLEFLKSTRLK